MPSFELKRLSEYTDDKIIAEIQRVARLISASIITKQEFQKHSRVSPNTVLRRFGSWEQALAAAGCADRYNAQVGPVEPAQPIAEEDQRRIGLRLRFKVSQRDNFKCVLCGASPAIDPRCSLHVDHVIPWSKGGKTTSDHLRTLCADCNLGKGNLSDS